MKSKKPMKGAPYGDSTSIGKITIEPTLKNATVFGGAIPLLDYMKKIEVTEILRKNLSVQKRGGKFPLADVATALIIYESN